MFYVLLVVKGHVNNTVVTSGGENTIFISKESSDLGYCFFFWFGSIYMYLLRSWAVRAKRWGEESLQSSKPRCKEQQVQNVQESNLNFFHLPESASSDNVNFLLIFT